MSDPHGNTFAALDAAMADLLVDTFVERDADGYQRMGTITVRNGQDYQAPEMIGNLTHLERESALVDEIADLTIWEVQRGRLPDPIFPLSGRETVKLDSKPGLEFSVDLSRTETRGEMHRIALVRGVATGMKSMRKATA